MPDPVPQSAPLLNPWVLPGLAVMVETIYAVALYLAFISTDKALFNIMCGAAIAQAAIPLQWYFGSSKSSQDKDASMAASSVKKDETIAANSAALAVSAPTATTTTTPVPEGTKP